MKNIRAFIITATIIILMGLACAVNTEAAEKYPYTKVTGTDGHFVNEKLGISCVLLECDHFPGRYWTRRSSDGWLTLQKLAKDPVAAGQVFVFERDVQIKNPSATYSTQWERDKWHTVRCLQDDYNSYLTICSNGFYFRQLEWTRAASGYQNPSTQLWRVRLVKDNELYQVIRLSSMSKNGAAAAGWGEARPRDYPW